MILNHTVPVCAVYGFDSNDKPTTTPDNIIYYRFFGHNLSIIKEAVKNNKEIIFPVEGFLELLPSEALQAGLMSYDEETDSLCIGDVLRFINNFPNSDDKVLPITLNTTAEGEHLKELRIALYSDPLIYGKPYEAILPEYLRNDGSPHRIEVYEFLSDGSGHYITSSCYNSDTGVIKIDNPMGGLEIGIDPKLT